MLLPLQQAPVGLPSADAWPALSASALPGAAQLQLGIERTFGGLGEAFGLGPARQLQEAWREMLVASVAKQRAQAEYLALVAQAFATGTATLMRSCRRWRCAASASSRCSPSSACGPRRSTRRCTTRCRAAPAST